MSETTIEDLNDDCLREVFHHLKLIELVDVADSCYRFRQIAQAHFAVEGDKKLVFWPFFQDSNIFGSLNQALLWSSKILRHFGRLFEAIDLRVTFTSDFGENFTNRIVEPLSQYCHNGNLKELHLQIHLTNRITEMLQPLLLHLQCFNLVEGNPAKRRTDGC